MATAKTELISQLKTAVTGWTTEVGAAQENLSKQIDGANVQLKRLLEVLRERNEHAVALARANEELSHLKRAAQQGDMPPGAVTQYAADSGVESAAAKELVGTFGRLQSAVQSWTTQVTDSQGGLVKQFAAANGQLSRLVELLGSGPNGSAAPAAPAPGQQLEAEFDRLRHENSVLSSEVYALNVELESLRRDQEAFASANLAAETERVVKQRGEIEQLEELLRQREDELEAGQRAEAGLNREIEHLQKEVSRFELSEDRLQQAVDRQREETGQHLAALSALTREMEALRHAFLGDGPGAAAPESADDVEPPEDAAAPPKADAEQIAALEAQIAQFELEREEVAVLKDRIADFQSQIAELENRPRPEDLEAAQQEAAELTSAIEALTAEKADLDATRAEVDALRGENEQLKAQLDELRDRPPREALETAQQEIETLNATVAQLGADRDAAAGEGEQLKTQVQELEAARDQIAGLQSAIEQTRGELEAAEGAAAELESARSQIADLQATLDQVNAAQAETDAAAGALEAARAQIADLEAAIEPLRDVEKAHETATRDLNTAQGRIAELQEQLAAAEAQVKEGAGANAEKDGLRAALAAVEEELEAMRRREEETVASARTLLEELESHRTYEAAQEKTLAESRAEVARLRATLDEGAERITALEEEQGRLLQQKAALEEELGSARSRIEALEAAGPANEAAAEETARQDAELHHAELQEYRDSLTTAEKRIADLEAQLDAARQRERELSGTTEELARVQEELDRAREELDAAREQARELAGKATEYEHAVSAQSEQGAELNAELERANATLGAQQQALVERDEQIEALRQDIAGMEAQLRELADQEAGAKQQTEELSDALGAMKQSDARYQEELEKNRALLDELRAEHTRQQTAVTELNDRGIELEGLLNAAREDERSTLATVDSLQDELDAVREKEQAEEEALAGARALVSAQQEALLKWEEQVSELEGRMAAMEAEKDQLSQESARQQEEIRQAMAQVNQAVHERDELLEELEAEKTKKERPHAGAAGEGLGAVDAQMAREERARQQGIVVSELTHSDASRSLGDILVDAELLSQSQLESALEEQQRDPSQLLGTILMERGYTTDDAIAQAVACQLKKPVVNPTEIHIQRNAIDALNKDLCTWHVCVPLRITADRMVVAMANPLDESAIMKLRDMSQREITPVVGTPSRIMSAIEDCYGTF